MYFFIGRSSNRLERRAALLEPAAAGRAQAAATGSRANWEISSAVRAGWSTDTNV